MQLFLLGRTGSVNITDPVILGLTRTFFPPLVGWAIAAGCLALLAAQTYRRRKSRADLGLSVPSMVMDCVRLGLLGAVMVAVILIFSANRGVPLSVLILVGAVAIMDVVCRRTVFGRRLFAVGANAQSAERVGISVRATIVGAFVLAGTFAALGGTSLFGGRGSAWSALLGALVIESVSNGMDLLALESSVKLMITGVVLVAAVIIDAMTRRSQE